MNFTVIDTKTGEYPDLWDIALHEEWAQDLMYCDMEGFATLEDGTLILMDECGRFTYCPEGRFQIVPDEPNEPLTLDELREMDGQPVYVVPENEYSELGGWCVISADDSDDCSCALVPGIDCWYWMFEAYGEQWLAYRRPPEGEEDT